MGTVTRSSPTPAPRPKLPWRYRASTRIFLALLSLGIFFVLVETLVLYLQVRRTLELSVRQTEIVSRLSLHFVETRFLYQINKLKHLLSNPGFRNDLTALPELQDRPVNFQLARTRLISTFVSQIQEPDLPLGIEHLWITDKQGYIWAASQKDWEGRSLPPALFQQVQHLPFQQPRFFIWADLNDFGLRDPFMGIVYRIQDPQHHDWWFFLFVSPQNMRSWLDGYQNIAWFFTLHLSDGRIYRYIPIQGWTAAFPSWPTQEELEQITVPSWVLMLSHLVRGHPVAMEMPGTPKAMLIYLPGEGGHLGILQPLSQGLPNTFWGVWISVRDQVAPVLRQGIQTSIFLIIGFIIVSILLSYGLSQRMAAPLLTMARQVQRFSEGAWDVRVPTQYTWGELTLLAQTFNHMAASLERIYRSLEDEVKRRTLQTELLRKWLQEHPPRSFADLQAYMTRAVQELQHTLPSGWDAVVVLWEPEDTAPKGRFSATSAPGASSFQEIRWVQEALRLKRPLMLTRETHARALREDTVAVWIYPLEFYEQPLGGLVLYRRHEQTEALPQETLLSMAQMLATALYFARQFWEHFEDQRYVQAQLRFLQSFHEETDLLESLFLWVRFLERYLPRSVMIMREQDGWHVLYPPSLAGRTLDAVFPLSRDQTWILEPDLTSLRAIQRYPKALREWMQQLGWKGMIAFPLWSPRQLLGLIFLGMEAPGEYPEALLRVIALGLQGLSLLLEQADLANENRAFREGMQFLTRALQAPSISQALSAFVRIARNVLQEDTDMIFAFAETPERITQTFLVLEGQETFHFVLSPLEQALIRLGLQENAPQLFHQTREILQRVETVQAPDTHVTRVPQSWAGLPLKFGDMVFGFWALRDMEQPYRFHADVLRRMEWLLPWLTGGLYALLHRHRLEQRLQRLEWIHSLGLHLMEMWDPRAVTEDAVREIQRLLQAEGVVVRLHEPKIRETLMESENG